MQVVSAEVKRFERSDSVADFGVRAHLAAAEARVAALLSGG